MKMGASELFEHYETLVHEYRADLERMLLIARASSTDPYGVIDRLNGVLAGEIARLKVQILDIDLKLARQPEFAGQTAIRPSLEILFPRRTAYGAGDTISIGADIVSYGMYHIELIGERVHRWAGPGRYFGFVAHIDRSVPLQAQLNIISKIHPDVACEAVTVDGEVVKSVWRPPHRLEFLIPPLLEAAAPVPTAIGFSVNQSLVIREVNPSRTDSRRVSLDITSVSLEAAPE